MSGHSKWATTKHKKAAIDAKRGKLFAKLILRKLVADADNYRLFYNLLRRSCSLQK